jgi:hypothetical protein
MGLVSVYDEIIYQKDIKQDLCQSVFGVIIYQNDIKWD